MIFAFGSHELDTRVYELRRLGAGTRPLEPQVFDVLAYLVQHRDRVVSKDELLEKLWPDRFVSEATLTSRVKAARKAVGDTGKNQSVIRTHHGRGYRFVAPVEERASPATGLIGCVAAEHVLTARAAPDVPPPVRQPGAAPGHGGDAPVLAAASGAGAGRGAPGREDFVGRHGELQHLTAALQRAASGSRQVLFVAGEAGAGKTTLVETFLTRTETAPWRVARGQCVEHRGSGEPYMPLLDAVGRLCRERNGSQVIDLLKREAPSWLVQLPSLLPDAEHAALVARTGSAGERMLREFATFMERLTADAPFVLLLEDLHWSDYATLDVVDLLARQHRPARLLLLGTYRPADMKASRHPMHAVSQELRVRGYCEVLTLPLLLPTELTEYLAHRFPGAPFNPELAALIHARTAGNPLFVGNLVDSWIDRRLIQHRQDGWAVEPSLATLETDVPDSLHHFIEQQVAELDPDQQRLLESAAVLGRTFVAAAVASALPAADEDVEREADALAREGRFLRADGSEPWGDGTLTARFAFTHDLFVDVLYHRIPAARRARLHHQVGCAIERAWSGRERDHLSALALHFHRGLDRQRGPRYLELAAAQALERSAYREAVSHLNGGLELVAGAPPGDGRDRMELALRCRLAPALIATRGYADAEVEENYLRARDLAHRLGDTALLSQALYGMANMYEYRGEYDVAERVASERMALDGAAASTINRMESHELLTCSFLHQGRYRESVEHGEKAMAASDPGDALDAERLVLLVQAHGWMSIALLFAGRLDDALRHSAEALRLADHGGDDLARASAAIQAAFMRFHCRQPEEVVRLAERGMAIARERRFPFHAACGRILSGWFQSTQGQYGDAEREIRAGIRICRSIGALMDLPVFLAMLAEPLAGTGDRPGALACLDEAIAIVDSGRTFFYEPELHRLRAMLRHEMGAPHDAVMDSLRTALALAERQGSPVFAARAAESLAAVQGDGRAPASRRAAAKGRSRSGRVHTGTV